MTGSTSRPEGSERGSSWRLAVICPNPAIDITAITGRFALGDNVGGADIAMRAGGKGSNLACVAADLGATPTLVAPLGGDPGEAFEKMLDSRVSLRRVAVQGTTRLCLTFDSSGIISEARGRGPVLSTNEWESFTQAAQDAALSADAVVIRGSFPPNTSSSSAERIMSVLDCPKIYVDTSGAQLEVAARLDGLTIAPNFNELHSLCGQEVDLWSINPSDRSQYALRWVARLQQRSRIRVLATLGVAGVGILAEDQWHLAKPPEIRGNHVGAGDAALAAFIGSEVCELPTTTALKRAAAAGASAASQSIAGRVCPDAVDDFEAQTTLVSVAYGQDAASAG